MTKNIGLDQEIYASQENFTQPLVLMVETFRRSGSTIPSVTDSFIY